MFKLIKDLKYFLEWRDTPHRDLVQIHELCMLAARRCAHDLGHAASEIRDTEMNKYFWEKHYMWRDIFYPVEKQKRYRHDLHDKIMRLERCQEKLSEVLKKYNIPYEEWEEYSPNGGIPF